MYNPVAAALASVTLGPEVVVDNLTMIPLLFKDSSTADRQPSTLDYSVLDEALAAGEVEITEISEQGSVPDHRRPRRAGASSARSARGNRWSTLRGDPARLMKTVCFLALLSFYARCAQSQFAPGTEALLHVSCPPEGKTGLTGDAKRDAEARNRAKRFIARNSTPVLLTVADLRRLQLETDPNASHAVRQLVPRHLRNLQAGALTVSEGDRASLTGYLHRAEEGSNSESVNCYGRDGRDIHLNVNTTKPVTAYDEWTGVVVEVTPQVPLPGYGRNDHVAVLHALQAVMLADLKILAIGSLTYDNEHRVNADKDHPNGSHPKRISLWELHPVLALYVCPKGMTCDPETTNVKWQTLKDWRRTHPARSHTGEVRLDAREPGPLVQ